VVVVVAAALWQLRIVGPANVSGPVGRRSGDLYNIYYPLYSFAYRGEEFLPQWNPFQMAGTPTIGYLAGGLCYPPNFLAAVLPVHRAMGLLAAMHVALGGVGTVLLARRLGVSAAGALLAALGFMTNAFFVDEHLRLQYLMGLAWMPFAALGLARLLASPTALHTVALALVLALQFLTGHAQIVCYEAYCALVLGLMAYAVGGASREVGHVRRVLVAAAGVVAGTMLLAAAQLLPTLEVVAQAVRGFGGLTVLQTLPPTPDWAMLRSAATSSGAVLLFAPLSVLAAVEHRRTVALLAAVGGLAAAVGCGTWLYTAGFYHLPGVSLFRVPQQMLVVAALAFVLLAGFGLDAASSRMARPARLLAVALVLAIVAGERFVHTSNTEMIPAANDDRFYAEPPFVRFLRGEMGADRMLVVKDWRRRWPLMEKLGSLHGLGVVQDYEPLTPQAYHRFLGSVRMNTDKPLFWGRFVVHPVDEGWRALDLLSTRYVVADPSVRWMPRSQARFRPIYRDGDAIVFENAKAFPRAMVVGAYRVVADDERALRTVLDRRFDPATEVVLDRAPAEAGGDEAPDVPAGARIVARSTTTVSIDVSTPRSAFLVLNDLHWPGWRATLDGRDAEVYRANFLFRAVAVPPGTHTVAFTYAATPLRIGLAISLLATLACAAIVARAVPSTRSTSP
jgi:hypothetical protein